MLLLIILFSVVAVLVHWFLTNRYGYWRKRGVPSPKPTLLLGHLGPSLVMKKNLGQIYERIYNDYKDCSYVGYYKFLKPGIIMRDMDLIKNILIRDFPSFHDNDLIIDAKIDPLFGNNPFVLRGQKWKQVRNLVTSGITTSKVKSMFCLISNVCKNFVDYLERQPYSKEGIEAKELACKFTTDAVASCAFGLEAKCLQDQESEFSKMGKKFISPTFWIGIKHTIIFILPSVSRALKIKFMPDDVEKWFYNIVKDTIEYRKKNKITRPDYLDMLMGLQAKTDNAFTMTDVAAQALTFYGDGFETSSITLAHTLFELADNLEVQSKLRNEIDSVLLRHNGEITYDSIQEMTYLDNVLHEGLRMHSPVPFMVRLCTKSFELPPARGEGTGPKVIIEPNTPIVIPVLGIHYDPNYFPNPHKFDPDRFNEENKHSRPKCTFLAFGEGPRICLGSKFGLAQTKAAIVAVISNFEVSVNPKTQRPLKIDPQYVLINAVGGIWLNFSKRKN